MARPEPYCVRLYPWLEANLGERCLMPLTGTDYRSLDAAVQIMEAFCYNHSDDLVRAFGLVVKQMQPKCQYLAFHCIALVMDWSDRIRIWRLAGLSYDAISKAPLCEGEPGGKDRPHLKAVGWGDE